jgi:hypothetical protein
MVLREELPMVLREELPMVLPMVGREHLENDAESAY